MDSSQPIRSRAGRSTKETCRSGDQKIQRGVSGEERAGDETSRTEGMRSSASPLNCPRCGGDISTEDFYGICPECRADLIQAFAGGARVVGAVEYEPTMNVTPNAVASKE